MSYTRDWDENSPIDHSKNSTWPLNDRRQKIDIAERLKNLFYGFISGETAEGIKNLPFPDAGSNPSTIADKISLYGKAVAGKTELHAKDEDGNVIQITSGGKLNLTPNIATIMGLVYPIGRIVTLGVSTNPNTLFGIGTWTAITGKVIVGIDGTAEFLSLDQTGGAKTINLQHNHGGKTGGVVFEGDGELTAHFLDQQHDHPIANDLSTAQSILNPYIVKYVWQRTA